MQLVQSTQECRAPVRNRAGGWFAVVRLVELVVLKVLSCRVHLDRALLPLALAARTHLPIEASDAIGCLLWRQLK